MTIPKKSRWLLAAAAASALALSACTPATDDGGATTGGDGSIAMSQGVTTEPCPGSPNPDNGCIYLGILSDLVDGPFAPVSGPLTQGQEDYWTFVNNNGGLDGFDVDVTTYKRDNKYTVDEQIAQYNQINGDIAGIAQTLGTSATQAILDDVVARDLPTVIVSWWSGFEFDPNVIGTGYSYCTESIVGLDWWASENGMPSKVQAVGYPGDYGGDTAAGVDRWAEVNGVEIAPWVETGPNAVVGNQDAVVQQVLNANPDVVMLGVAPGETAEIVGKLAAMGFEGEFLGASPTWNKVLPESAAGPALAAKFHYLMPYDGWDGDSQAVKDMHEFLNGAMPEQHGYAFGWALGYPMQAMLEEAIVAGDLTPAGIKAQMDGLEVDYKGFQPNTVYDVNNVQANAVQAVNVFKPSETGSFGIEEVANQFVGTTFDKTDYSSACVVL